MARDFRVSFLAAMTATLLPAVVLAQAPPVDKAPVAPKAEQLDPSNCAPHDIGTQGKGGDSQAQQPADSNLSDKLAKSDGVICPPPHADTEINAPTPPGGRMPVIPPPGSPGGDPSVRPK